MVDPVDPSTIQALVWIAYGGPVAALTTAALVAWRRWRARERRGAPAGSESFFGRVAPTSDFRPAGDGTELVRIEIEQQRVDSRGGQFWQEVERRVTASPFELSLADGRRLRVEPDARAVVAELESANVAGDQPSAVGRLLAGQEAHVTGVLAANGRLR